MEVHLGDGTPQIPDFKPEVCLFLPKIRGAILVVPRIRTIRYLVYFGPACLWRPPNEEVVFVSVLVVGALLF